jgi:PAS domain S-box-containing protein
MIGISPANGLRIGQEENLTGTLVLRLEDCPFPAWIYDEESLQIVDMNNRALQLNGLTRAQSLALRVTDLAVGDVASREVRASTCQASDPAKVGRYRKADGEIIGVRLETSRIRLADRPACFVAAIDLSQEGRALAESERRNRDLAAANEDLRQLLETASDCYWETDACGDITFISPECEVRYGNPVGDRLDNRLNTLPNMAIDLESGEKALAAMRLRQPFRDIPYSHSLADGRRIEIRTSGVPIIDGDGRFSGWRIMAKDVTAEVEADRALRASEQQLRELFEISSDWYWECDADGRSTFLSPNYEAATNIPQSEVLGRRLIECQALSLNPQLAIMAVMAMKEGRPYRDLAYSWTYPDGTKRWFKISGAPHFGVDGTFRGYRGTGAEVTSAVEAGAASQLAQRRIEAATAHVAQPFAVFDAEERMIAYNEAFGKLIRPAGSALDASVEDIAEWRDKGSFVRDLLAALLQRGFYAEGADGTVPDIETLLAHYCREGEYTYHLSDGRWMLVTYRRLPGDATVALWSDVTALKHAEEALRAAKEAAERANLAKSDFLTNMSHEIRTPMNGIIGMTALLLDTPLTETQRGFGTAICDCADALLTVINDILDISKLEAGKIDLETIDFDLVDTVESAAFLLAPKAQEKHLDLVVFVDPAVLRRYCGDPTRLRQALLNLIGNAIKFTEEGGISIEVAVEPAVTPLLRFDVTDTGIGMTEATQSRLFEKFAQADSSVARRYGGTGLGLSISKQLVEMMGGRFEVSSRPGVGSRFTFILPMAPAAGVAPPTTLPDHLEGLRVLVVDDLAMNLRLFERQLAGFGMLAKGVGDPLSALQELELAVSRGEAYDLAILDEMMPDMPGHVLVERIRAVPALAQTKLVLLSSTGEPSAVGSWDTVLLKPMSRRALRDRLSGLFGTGPTQSAASETIVATTQDVKKLRVLLAEDNKINQQIASAILQKAGYGCDIVNNGRAAVEAVQHSIYDVILMDVQMPDMDGVEATKFIRALPPPKNRVRIIAMTAHAMSGAREMYVASGMNDYISKPISVPLLLEKLAECTVEN